MNGNELMSIVNRFGEIAYAEKCEKYTIIYNSINKQTVVVDLSLDEIEKSVPEMKLLRVHKSHLININQVAEIVESGLCLELKLLNGKRIIVSKRKKKELLRQLNLL